MWASFTLGRVRGGGLTVPIVKVGMPDRETLMPALEAVLYSGMIAEGEAVYEFERRFAATFGLPSALAMSSGTAALHASLHLAGAAPGAEVISTAMTAEPTNLAVLHAGAKLVWADVDPASGNIDPDSIAARITPATRAIIVVHYAGYPVRMDEIMEVARARGVAVIEDCAHALGARYGNRPIGTMGDFGIYSLQAIKHMTTVDGGMLTMRDPRHLEAAKRFRWFGLRKGIPRTEVDLASIGYKYNMNNVTATIGLAQLGCIGARIDRHVENGRFFDAAFSGLNHVRPAAFDAAAAPSYWLYTLLCEDSRAVQSALEARGVVASKLHKRNDSHSLFADSAVALPGLDQFSEAFLHLPCGWWVGDEERTLIAETVRVAGSSA